MQPLDPNSLCDYVRLGVCIHLNLTNSVIYRRDYFYVDPDVEAEDCSEHYVHYPMWSLLQSPVHRSHFLGNGLLTSLGVTNRSLIPSSRQTNFFGLGLRILLEMK